MQEKTNKRKNNGNTGYRNNNRNDNRRKNYNNSSANKKKNQKDNSEQKKQSDVIVICIIVAGLVFATAAYLFVSPKASSSRQTRVVVSQDDPTLIPDSAYMTVTVPSVVESDMSQAEGAESGTEESSAESAAESADTEANTSSTEVTAVSKSQQQPTSAPSSAPNSAPANSGSSNTGNANSSGNPSSGSGTATRTYTSSSTPSSASVSRQYYVDRSTGNEVSAPGDNTDTVYVIEYDKSKTAPSEKEVQQLIMDYLGVDTVPENFVGMEIDLASASSDAASQADDQVMIIEDAPEVKTGDNSAAQTGNNPDVKTANTVSDTVNPVEAAFGDVTADHTSSAVFAVNYEDSLPEANVRDDLAGLQLTWNLNMGTDGEARVTPLGVTASRITAVDWYIQAVAGTGGLADTTDPYIKKVRVDDGGAIRVVVVATYVDGSTRSSNMCLIAHENYSSQRADLQ